MNGSAAVGTEKEPGIIVNCNGKVLLQKTNVNRSGLCKSKGVYSSNVF